MYAHFQHGQTIQKLVEQVEVQIAAKHKEIDAQAASHQYAVLQSFRENKVTDGHLLPTYGYGYDDFGRDTLECIYATLFGGESAIVRNSIISGTHAIKTSLFGLLRPNDELLYISGRPYDTLEEIVGLRGENNGSFKEWGIGYNQVGLTAESTFDWDAIAAAITEKTKVIGIQRSKGYSSRESLRIDQLAEAITFVKKLNPELIVFVDNCYGEFVERCEPCAVGADVIAGSLIKNPGGGLAKTGGYIVGREDLIEKISYHLTSPGIGREAGASLDTLHSMYHGLFLAPHVVAQALKGAVFTSAILSELGLETHPKWDANRTDLIQSVTFHEREPMIAFCQAIQYWSPINAQFAPEPAYMPGYADDVIMAAGTFVQGASIELSADGPLRAPFTAYVQGGLTYEHVKVAICGAIDNLMKKGLLSS
ncbi:MAG: aminotransferase class I/II-fold pyridoxal phosphate-dependent enzyme [Bacilli bacterium]